MANKLGKFLLFSALAGAAAAGAYYFLKDRNDEDFFEDSDPDVNDDLEEFLKNESGKGPDPVSEKREYVPLNFSREAVQDASLETPESDASGNEASKEDASVEEPVKAVSEDGSAAKISEVEVSKEDSGEDDASGLKERILDKAEKISEEGENIIGKPLEEAKNSVEKAADRDDSHVSTFSFSSFE